MVFPVLKLFAPTKNNDKYSVIAGGKNLNPPQQESVIKDRGGTRSGRDRRRNNGTYDGVERRSGRDRRRGFDRRSGLARRRGTDRRGNRSRWDGSFIERRDAFRR